MRRIAAIWNRPAIQAGQAGAALGAAVAGAVALVDENDASTREEVANRLRAAIYADKPVTEPDASLVAAYHSPEGYLDRLEATFEAIWR